MSISITEISITGRQEAYLLAQPDGALLCTWFAGTQEGKADISVLLSRRDPVAGTWSELVQLSDDPTRSELNLILFQAPGGPLWLLWTAQLAGNQDTAIVRRRLSTDDGHSWGPMEALIDTPGTFVRQPPVVLAHGDWLLPIFHCIARPGEKWVGSHDTSAVLGFPAIKAAAGPSMPCPRAPAACTLAWICLAFIARAGSSIARAGSSAIANACR